MSVDTLLGFDSSTKFGSKAGLSSSRILGNIHFTNIDASTKIQVGSHVSIEGNRIRLGDLGAGSPVGLADGDIFYNASGLQLQDNGNTRTVLHDASSLAGDVTGPLGATVVGNDSHTHGNGTLPGVPGAGIDTSVANLRGYTVQTGAPAAGDILRYSGSQWEHEAAFGAWAGKSIDTSYLAASDGFVVVTVVKGSETSWAQVAGYTDGSNPPTTKRGDASYSCWTGVDYPTYSNSFMMPARKGDYWKVVRVGFGGTAPVITIFWMPLG